MKLYACIKGLKYPVIDYAKAYGRHDETINYAKGELSKPNQSRWPEKVYIGKRFLGSGKDENGEYDTISIYLGDGWFKLISKVY
jgi:hypothetical protein